MGLPLKNLAESLVLECLILIKAVIRKILEGSEKKQDAEQISGGELGGGGIEMELKNSEVKLRWVVWEDYRDSPTEIQMLLNQIHFHRNEYQNYPFYE